MNANTKLIFKGLLTYIQLVFDKSVIHAFEYY